MLFAVKEFVLSTKSVSQFIALASIASRFPSVQDDNSLINLLGVSIDDSYCSAKPPYLRAAGNPLYLCGTPRKTSLPPRRAAEKTSLPPRRAPNNEMSLEVTQHNYVDDIGHRAPGRAITCHFLITPIIETCFNYADVISTC